MTHNNLVHQKRIDFIFPA